MLYWIAQCAMRKIGQSESGPSRRLGFAASTERGFGAGARLFAKQSEFYENFAKHPQISSNFHERHQKSK